MQPPRTTNGLAVAALVLGILWLGGIGAVLALIFGLIALSQIKAQPERYTGRGMAIAGVVLGAIGIIVPIIAVIALVFVAESVDDNDSRSPFDATETTIQQSAVTAVPPETAPPETAPPVDLTMAPAEPSWTVASASAQLGLTAPDDDGFVSCGTVTLPAARYVISDTPFYTVGVYDSAADATAYLDGIVVAINATTAGAVQCFDSAGVLALTFDEGSLATRVDPAAVDEVVNIAFAEGGNVSITQSEVRCGNVIVSGPAVSLAEPLTALGC